MNKIAENSRGLFNRLRSDGFKIDIHHTRAVKNGFLYSHTCDGKEVFERCITRREFYNLEGGILVQSKLICTLADTGGVTYKLKEYIPKKFGDAIASCGGFTQVAICPTREVRIGYEPEVNIISPGELYIGKYNFPKSVQYNKAEGFLKAFQRATNVLNPQVGGISIRLIDLLIFNNQKP